ncbi:hypothetical protein V6N11_077486 [Hibiscus sabdariffa]|uniref:Uncharacterized protein n=1 Tax=Hibiscus sabdariffa TaxID=183260 RepID=A0ABR2TD88_9ROSI
MTTAPVTVPVSAPVSGSNVHDSVPNEPMASAEAGCSNESLPVVLRSSRVVHKPSYLNRYYCNNTYASSCLYPVE